MGERGGDGQILQNLKETPTIATYDNISIQSLINLHNNKLLRYSNTKCSKSKNLIP